MCLIVFGYHVNARYKFVLAANRDEFYERPTARADFWRDAPEVLAGRDLVAGGTWLGITKNGRFAAVTNYRSEQSPAGKKSRGDLTKRFLIGGQLTADYLLEVEREKNDYSGFNLLIGNFGNGNNELFYCSNHGVGGKNLSAGIYGLSNASLDTDWHKVERSKTDLQRILQTSDEINVADLFQILADKTIADDQKLPKTGVGFELERTLSPVFIATADYGTRSSTVLLIETNGVATFIERTFTKSLLDGEIKHQYQM